MPFLVNMVRRWVLVTIALPVGGKLLGALSRRLKSSRGESGVTSALDKVSSAATARGRRAKRG